MHDRFSPRALLLLALALPIAACTNPLIDSLAVSPSTQAVTVGQTAQFTATGTVGHGSNHPSTTQDDTNSVTWTSSSPAVATISSTGLATGVAAGTTTITASMNGFTGTITASATLTVTGSGIGGGTTPTADVTSITLIPNTQSVAAPGGTALFIPIGTTSTGATVNLTGLVAWASSSNMIAQVDSTGNATAKSQGTATITAVYSNADKTVATGTATFQVLSGSSNLVTALNIFPTSGAATAVGQQTQFTALGTESSGQFDVTGATVWTSSNTAIATVGTAGSGTPGLVTAVGPGTANILATYTNAVGGSIVTATASYTFTSGSAPEQLLSINVVPSGTTVSNKGMTGQYLAFGTFSSPPLVRDLTDEVTWISLLPEVASINSGGTPGEVAGLATAQGYTGDTVIYAEDTKSNLDGTVVLSNSQTFTCKDSVSNVCDPGVATPQFATITVFVVSENTFVPNMSLIGPDGLPYGEYVTAPSDTLTPNLIHCDSSGSSPAGSSGGTSQWALVGGTGGSVCTGTYEVGTQVKVTENLPAGSSYFGGWSSGSECAESNLKTTTTCTLTLTGNATVGVIFY